MNTKRTIVFRADGNSEVGLGHVMRCIALCEMLNGLFYLKFAIQDPSLSIQEILNTSVSEIIALPKTIDYIDDANNLLSMLSIEDMVVLDGYYFDSDYQKIVKLHCRKLIYIDDLVVGYQYADVVINHNGLVKDADYDAASTTSFLLGTKYALVRKDFFEKSRAVLTNIFKCNSTSLLINLGGADPENISLAVLNTIYSQKQQHTITLILGAANKNAESFESYNSATNVRIKKGLSAIEMIDEINACDVAIVSCSTIAYEVSILNKPFVGILTASNQKSNADFFETNKLALAVLDTQFTAEALLKSIKYDDVHWIESLQNQRLFFDGKTIARFQQTFLTL